MNVSITIGEDFVLGGVCSDTVTTSSSFVDIADLSVTITTKGRPVMLILKPNDTNDGIFGLGYAGTPTADVGANLRAWFKFLRGATAVSTSPLALDGRTSSTGSLQAYGVPPTIFDSPPAGTYTYKVQFKAGTDTIAFCKYMQIIAIEL